MKRFTKLIAALFALSLIISVTACNNEQMDLGLYASLDRTLEQCVAVEATVTAQNPDAIGYDSFQAKVNFNLGLPTAGNLKVISQANPDAQIEAWLVDSTYYLAEPYETPRNTYFTLPTMSHSLLKHSIYQRTYLVSPYNLIAFNSLTNLLDYNSWILDEKVSDTEYTAWINYGVRATIILENGLVKTMTVETLYDSYSFTFKYDTAFEISAPSATFQKLNTASVILNGEIDYFEAYESGDELYLSYYMDYPSVLCEKLELFKDANFTQAYVDELPITSDVTLYAKVTEHTGINKTIADAYKNTTEQKSLNVFQKTGYYGSSYSATFISKFVVENGRSSTIYQSYHTEETNPASETTEEFWVEGIVAYMISDERFTCTMPEGGSSDYLSVLAETLYYLQEALNEGEFTLADGKYTLDSWEVVIADGLLTSFKTDAYEVEFSFGEPESGFIPERTGEFEKHYVVHYYYYEDGEYTGGMRSSTVKDATAVIEENGEIYTMTLDRAGTQPLTADTEIYDFMMIYRHLNND